MSDRWVGELLDGLEDLPVDQTISPNDLMYRTDPTYYFHWASEGLRSVVGPMAMAGPDRSAPRRILDLPCGHGRVLRALRAAFPDAEVVACDLDREAVDFCATTFGATPVYSADDPASIVLPGTFDLIWCGSLLTHLDAPQWPGFVRLFADALTEGGIVVFTTHGRHIARLLGLGHPLFPFDEGEVRGLIEAMGETGFAYRDYEAGSRYGISLSAPAWVLRRILEVPTLDLLSYTERGWNNHHDVVACRRDGTHDRAGSSGGEPLR